MCLTATWIFTGDCGISHKEISFLHGLHKWPDRILHSQGSAGTTLPLVPQRNMASNKNYSPSPILAAGSRLTLVRSRSGFILLEYGGVQTQHTLRSGQLWARGCALRFNVAVLGQESNNLTQGQIVILLLIFVSRCTREQSSWNEQRVKGK